MKIMKNLLGKVSKRTLALILATLLSLGGATAGTLAWLIDQSPEVKNTFTYGDVNIGLEETPTDDGDDDPTTNTYEMMPGKPIVKDPKVTVKAGTEDCWVFVKMTKSANFDDFLTYEMAQDAEGNPIWTALENTEGVFYCTVDKTDVDVVLQVLKDDQVLVQPTVTKEMLNALDDDGAANYPTLNLQAYAVQRDATLAEIATPADAWATMLAQNTAGE